ncbi:zinc finger protein OZF-like isoform X7 [Colias croceus]|uniref:zinc finger protein OZF-like isoform X7 n=1 Tax=Colias crocea TaxID=72248 RepID=UPI001E27C2DD|nr:zinc finger protein OZF-like isoform X7 [Colias croceus]
MEGITTLNGCCACLSTKYKLKPMNHEEIYIYNRLLLKDCIRETMFICVFCRTLLNKINKFIKQCELAQQLMNNFNMDNSIEMTAIHNLSTSSVELNYYLGDELMIKDEDDVFDDDIPLILLSNNSDNCELEDETSDHLNVNSLKEENSVDNLQELEVKEDIDFKNGAHLCAICGQYCPSTISLRGHIKSHTTKYKCKICNIVRHSRQHVLEHYSLVHTNSMPEYKCKECDFTTNKRTVMQRHVRMHANSEKHTCHQCGRSFKSREILRVHTSRHDDKNRYHCEHCNRTFIYKSVLHKHIRSVHIDKDFYCVECDVMFTSMEALKQHLYKTKKHSDPSQYKYACTLCDQRFLTRQTLGTHQTSVHNAPKPSRCVHCARAYSTADALRLHVRRAHLPGGNSKSATCHICDKVFSRKGVLKVHMRVHTGERPYACECGVSFTQLASLKAHEAAKHRK